MIESAKYLEQGNILAVIDGRQFSIPDDMTNRDRRKLAEWVDEGNIIQDYVAPPPPLPTDTPLTPVRFRAILAILGMTIEQVNTAIDNVITDPVENAVAKARVTDSENYQRDNPLFSLLGPSLGFTDAQLDAAWPTALAI